MDCSLMQKDLLDYHFGVAEAVCRQGMEDHLLSCKVCLRAYLDLKRAIETLPAELLGDPTGDLSGERPAAKTRQRLRAEVERTFVAPRRLVVRRLGGFFLHPIPLYQAAAAFLLLISAGLLPAMLRTHPGGLSPAALSALPTGGERGGEIVDTSRQRAASLNLY